MHNLGWILGIPLRTDFLGVGNPKTTEKQTCPITYKVFSEAQQNTEPNFYQSRQISYPSLCTMQLHSLKAAHEVLTLHRMQKHPHKNTHTSFDSRIRSVMSTLGWSLFVSLRLEPCCTAGGKGLSLLVTLSKNLHKANTWEISRNQLVTVKQFTLASTAEKGWREWEKTTNSRVSSTNVL